MSNIAPRKIVTVTLPSDPDTRDRIRALSDATGLQQKEIIRLLALRATPKVLLAVKAELVSA